MVFEKLGSAKGQRLQSCVFLGLQIGIQDRMRFSVLEYIFHESVDLFVSVSLLLAAIVGEIIGTQYIPSFHFFFGPSNTELRSSVLIVSSPSSLMCLTSYLLMG